MKITTSVTDHADAVPARRRDDAESRLRAVLTTNAATSGVSGALAAILDDTVDSMLGTDTATWVRSVGAGLIVFAAVVLLIARAPTARLTRLTPAVSVGDAAWVVGTAATIAVGWYSTGGAAVMAVVAVMVGTFGATQAMLVRRVRSDD